MASACEFNAPNGQPSLLYRRLVHHVGETKAASLWEKVRTPEWQRKNGAWLQAVEVQPETEWFTGEKVAGPDDSVNLINPNATYDVWDLNKPLPEKTQLLKQFGIKLYKNKAYYVPTAAEISRIIAYNKKGQLGSTKLGFTLSGKELFHEVTYKVIDGKSYIFVDFSEFVESDGVKVPVITGRFRIEAAIVKSSDIGAFKRSIDLGKTLEQAKKDTALSAVPNKFSTKYVSVEKAVSFGKRMMNLQIISLAKTLLKETYDYDDLVAMDDEAYLYLIRRIINVAAKEGETMADKEIRRIANELAVNTEKLDELPEDWGVLLDALPEAAKKLITVEVIDDNNSTGQFNWNPSVNMQGYRFEELGVQLLGNELMEAAAPRIAFKQMLNDGLITQEQLDIAQREYKSVYEILDIRRKKGTLADKHIIWQQKFAFTRAMKVAKISLNDYYTAVNGAELDIYAHMLNTDPRTAQAADLFSILRKVMSKGSATDRFLTSTISVSRKIDAANIAEDPDKAAFVALSHEFGHAIDFYLNMTSKEKRQNIVDFIEQLVKDTGDGTTNLAGAALHVSLIKRNYGTNDSLETMADVFSVLLTTMAFGGNSAGKVNNTYINDVYTELLKALKSERAAGLFDAFLGQYYTAPASGQETTDAKILGFFAQLFEDFKKFVNYILGFPAFDVSVQGIQTTEKQVEQLTTLDKLLSVVFDKQNFDIRSISRKRTQGFIDSNAVMNFIVNKNSNANPAIGELFDRVPELQNTGTQAQYEEYLGTIFPESEHRGVAYRANANGIASSGGKMGGIWFADSEEAVTNFVKEFNRPETQVSMAVLNMTKPKVYESFWGEFTDDETRVIDALVDNNDTGALQQLSTGTTSTKNILAASIANAGHDSIRIGDDVWNDGEYLSEGEQFVVFNEEQIHELGTDADIEGFRKYVQDNILDLEVAGQSPAQKMQDLIKANLTKNVSKDTALAPGMQVLYAPKGAAASPFLVKEINAAGNVQLVESIKQPDGSYIYKNAPGTPSATNTSIVPVAQMYTFMYNNARYAASASGNIISLAGGAVFKPGDAYHTQLWPHVMELQLIEFVGNSPAFEGMTDEFMARFMDPVSGKVTNLNAAIAWAGDIMFGDAEPAVSDRAGNPETYTNHSGGAIGYDAEWDVIGAEYGMVNNKHYLLPVDGQVADPRLRAKGVKPVDATADIGEVAMSGPAKGEAQIAVTNAERAMGRIEPTHVTRNTKKIRNYAQVKNADAVFAIGSLIPKEAEITIARGQQSKTALVPQVNGGTSVAVQLGITMGKPVYVFNQVANSTYGQGWYAWDAKLQDFVSTGTPVLTKNFAGIGTSSNTTKQGQQAIRDVYELTFPKAVRDGQITQAEVTAALAKPAIPQKYYDGGLSIQGTLMQTKVPGRTSGEMIRNGERTETTRSGNQFTRPKVGDLEVHYDDKGKMLVRVTSEPYTPNKADFDAYEGWADGQWERSEEHFTKAWFSYRFEYIGDIVNGKLVQNAPSIKTDKNGEPTVAAVLAAEGIQPVPANQTPDGPVIVEPNSILSSTAIASVPLSIEYTAGTQKIAITANSESKLLLSALVLATPTLEAESTVSKADILQVINEYEDDISILENELSEVGYLNDLLPNDIRRDLQFEVLRIRAIKDLAFREALLATAGREIQVPGESERAEMLTAIRAYALNEAPAVAIPSHGMTRSDFGRGLYIQNSAVKSVLDPGKMQSIYELIKFATMTAFSKQDKYSKLELHKAIVDAIRLNLLTFQKELANITNNTIGSNTRKYQKRAEQSGRTLPEITKNLEDLFKPAGGKVSGIPTPLVIDHIVRAYVFDFYAEEFGVTKSASDRKVEDDTEEEQEETASTSTEFDEDEEKDATGNPTLRSGYDEDVFSLAPHKSATMRMKGLLSAIELKPQRIVTPKRVSIAIKDKAHRNYIAETLKTKMPLGKGPYTTFFGGTYRLLTIKSGDARKSIGLELTGDKMYGKVKLSSNETDTEEYLVKALKEYKPADFDALKPVLIREGLITPDATSYTGEAMIYEFSELYTNDPVQTTLIWNAYGTGSFANYEIIYGRILQTLSNSYNLVWKADPNTQVDIGSDAVNLGSATAQDGKKTVVTSAYDRMIVHPDQTIRDAAILLDKQPENVRNEFIKLMQQTQNNEFKLLIDQDAGGTFTFNIVRGDRSSTESAIKRRWQQAQSQSPVMITLEDHTQVMDMETIKELKDRVIAATRIKNGVERTDTLKDLAAELFKLYGIDYTPQMINTLFNRTVYRELTQYTGFKRSVGSIFSFTKDGKPQGVLAALLAHDGRNPILDESRSLNVLTQVYMMHDKFTWAPAYKNNEGKTVWPHGLGSFVSSQVTKWNNGVIREPFVDASGAIADRFMQHNPWLHDKGKLKQLSSTILGFDGGINSRESTQPGKGRSKMELAEIELISLAGFLNEGKKQAAFYGLTNSDKKNVNVFYQELEARSPWWSNAGGTPGTNSNRIFDMMAATFSMEYNRARNSRNAADMLFYIMPQLNLEQLLAYEKQGVISEGAHKALYDSDGKLRLDLPWDADPAKINWNSTSLVVIRNEILPAIFHSMINRQRNQWRKLQILKAPTKKYVPTVKAGHDAILSEFLRQEQVKVVLLKSHPRTQDGATSHIYYEDAIGDTVTLSLGRVSAQAHNPNLLPRNAMIEWYQSIGIEENDIEANAALFDEEYYRAFVTVPGTKVDEEGFATGSAEEFVVDKKSHDYYSRLLNDNGMKASELNIQNAILIDYVASTFEFNSQVLPMIANDPALFVNMSKFNAAKTPAMQVFTIMQEYNKRLAGVVAPGYRAAWEAGAKFTAITIADPRTESSELKEAGLDWKEINTIGDAQEFLTVDEWLDNLFKMGEIDTQLYHEMKNVIPKDGSYYEFTEPAHLKIIRQPQKPVYFGKRLNGNVNETDYVKSSSIVLYPPDLGTGLQKLRQAMEVNNIQRAHFGSGRKSGGPKAPLDFFDNDANAKPVTAMDIRAASTIMSRDNLLIQQYVPYDEKAASLYIVTQANKNLIDMVAVNIDQPIKLAHKEQMLDGEQLIERKRQIINRLLTLQADKAIAELGNNEKAILEKIREAGEAGAGLTFAQQLSVTHRAPDGSLSIPFMQNPSYSRLQNIAMNLVNKPLKLYFPGSSFVQATSAGSAITDETIPTGVVYVDGHDASQRLHSERLIKDGTEVLHAQIILPFMFRDSKGKKLKMADFTKQVTDDAGVTRTVLDMDKIPKQLLRTIGLRIPNQKHSTMLAFEIVGFLPEGVGKVAIVPADITRQMGSDFDVDKLFMYKYNSRYNAETGKLEVDNSDEIKTLQNDYVELFETILTAPAMYPEVMSSVDQPDISDLNKKYRNISLEASGFERYVLNADYVAQRTGKDLIGVFAKLKTFEPLLQGFNNIRLARLVDRGDGKLVLESELTQKPTTFKLFADMYGSDSTPIKYDSIGGLGGSMNTKGIYRSRGFNINVFLSEAVDYSKQRAFDGLNINLQTAPAIAAMLMLQDSTGRALSVEEIVAVLKQPIIERFTELQSVNGTVINVRKSDEDTAMELLTQMGYSAERIEALKKEEKYFTLAELDANINTLQHQTDSQAYILLRYLELLELGTSLRTIQSHSDMDVKGMGKDILAALTMTELIKTDLRDVVKPTLGFTGRAAAVYGVIYNDVIDGSVSMLDQLATFEEQKDTLTEKGMYILQAMRLYKAIVLPLVPAVELYGAASVVATIAGRTSDDIIDADSTYMKDFMDYYRAYSVSSSLDDKAHVLVNTAWKGNLEAMRKYITRPEMAPLLYKMQLAYPNNLFLKNLSIFDNQKRKVTDPVIIVYRNKQLTHATEEQVYGDLVELLREPDKGEDDAHAEVRAFVNELVMAQLLFGTSQDSGSFLKYLHPALLEILGVSGNLRMFEQFLKEGKHGPKASPGFVQEFFQHFPEHSAVTTPYQLGLYLSETQGVLPPTFSVIRKKPNGESTGLGRREFISVKIGNKYRLYKIAGATETTVMYKELPLLGNRVAFEANTTQSIFDDNRTVLDKIKQVKIIPYTPQNLQYEMAQMLENENGAKKAGRILDMIRSFDDVQPHLQAVASAFKQVTAVTVADVLPENKATKLGSYNATTTVMTLNMQNIQKVSGLGTNMGAYTFLHEYSHTIVEQTAMEFLKTNRFHQTALDTAMEAMRQSVEVMGGENAERWSRPLNNLKEFMSYMMTDKEFIEFANSVMMPEGFMKQPSTIWEYFKSFVTALFNNLAKAFNIKVNADSILFTVWNIMDEAMSDRSLSVNDWESSVFSHKDGKKYMVHTLNGKPVSVTPTSSHASYWATQTNEARRQKQQDVITEWLGENPEPVIEDDPAGNNDGKDIFGFDDFGLYQLTQEFGMTQGQRKATDEILTFAKQRMATTASTLAEKSWLLSGAGGTGKTTILRKILHQLHVEYGIKLSEMTFLAPTHQAIGQLARAFDYSIKPKTIASAVGLQVTSPTLSDASETIYNGSKDPAKLKTAKVIVIDESSMISDEDMAILQRFIDSNQDAIVIFSGDMLQLGPINSNKKGASQMDKLRNSLSWPMRTLIPAQRFSALTENMRSEFSDLTMAMLDARTDADVLLKTNMQGDFTLRFPTIPAKPVTPSEHVHYVRNEKQFINAAVESFMTNPGLYANIVLAYRNETVNYWNKKIRDGLFGANAGSVELGEYLVQSSQALLVDDNDESRIEYFNDNTGQHGYNALRLQVLSVNAEEPISLPIPEVIMQNDTTGLPDVYVLRLNAIPIMVKPDESTGIKRAVRAYYHELSYNDQVIIWENDRKVVTPLGTFYSMISSGRRAALPPNFTAKHLEIMAMNDVVVVDGMVDGSDPAVRRFFYALRVFNFKYQLSYGYASTVHKAQGAGFDFVFGGEEDVRYVQSSRPQNREDSNLARALYTVYSRARKGLTLLHKNFNIQEANNILNLELNMLAGLGNNTLTPVRAETKHDEDILSPFTDDTVLDLNLFSGKTTRGGDAVIEVHTTEKQRLLAALRHQLKLLRDSVRSEEFDQNRTKDRFARRIEADKLAVAIDAISKEPSLNLGELYQLAETHLKWASTILAKPSAAASLYDLVRAYEMSGIWANIVPLLRPTAPADNSVAKTYEQQDAPFRELEELAGRATTMQNGLLSNMANRIVVMSGRRPIANLDQTHLNSFSYQVYSRVNGLSNSENELLAYASNEIMKRQIARDADEIMLTSKLEKLSQRKSTIEAQAGKSMWSMITAAAQSNAANRATNTWGLIGMLSTAYDTYNREAFAKFNAARKILDREDKTAAEKDAALTKAATRYKEAREKRSMPIDIRRIWDFELEIPAPKPELDAYIAELESLIADDAETVVRKAIAKIEKFYTDLSNLEDVAYSNAKTDGLVPGTPEFAANVKAQLDEFREMHSPSYYFNPSKEIRDAAGNVTGIKDLSLQYQPGGLDAYIVLAPKMLDVNLDEKYITLLEQVREEEAQALASGLPNNGVATQVLQWLDDYKALMKTLVASYPPSSGEYKPDTFLPAIESELAAVTKKNPIAWAMRTRERLLEDYTDNPNMLDDSKASLNALTQAFNRNSNGAMSDERYDELSHDLMRIAEIYGHHAIHFRQMTDVMDLIMATDVLLREQKFTSDAAKAVGIASWEYMLTKTVFRHPKALEGGVGPVFRNNLTKESWRAANDLDAMIAELEALNTEDSSIGKVALKDPQRISKALRKSQIAARKKELNKAIAFSNKRMPLKQLYGSKAIDKMIEIQQLKSFAWNPVTGAINFVMSWMAGHINASGREDIMPEDYNYATRKLIRYSSKVFATAADTAFARKVYALLKMSNMSGTLKDSTLGQSNLSEYLQWFEKYKFMDPYFMMTGGDEMAKAATIYALAQNTKVTKSDGTVISLWDGMGENGMWNESKHGPMAGYGDTANGEESTRWSKFASFISKAQALVQPVTGETDPRTALYAKQTVIGRATGQFRLSWIPEGFRHRFAGYVDYNYKLQRAFKGRYRTALDIGLIEHTKLMLQAMLPKALVGDIYEGVTVNTQEKLFDMNGQWTGKYKRVKLKDAKTDYANELRNAAAAKALMVTSASLYLLTWLASEAAADDDKEGDQLAAFWRLMANMSARQYQDLMFYANPMEASSLLRGIWPWIQVPGDFLKFIQATQKFAAGDTRMDAEEYFYRFSKNGLILPHMAGFAKIRSYLTRDVLSY